MANDLTGWELHESPQRKWIREMEQDMRWYLYRLNAEQRRNGLNTEKESCLN
jgi:hypothetical protein